MEMEGGPSIPIDCTQFLTVRDEELRIVDRIVLGNSSAVLDIGCGIGRHLATVRDRHPEVCLYGEDICDALIEKLRKTFGGENCVFGKPSEDIRPQKIDLVMLTGNGLGVLGDQVSTVANLDEICSRIPSGGTFWTETGNPFGEGFTSPRFTITDGDSIDGPFAWGYASESWITNELSRRGFDVEIVDSAAPGGMFFHAVGTKR